MEGRSSIDAAQGEVKRIEREPEIMDLYLKDVMPIDMMKSAAPSAKRGKTNWPAALKAQGGGRRDTLFGARYRPDTGRRGTSNRRPRRSCGYPGDIAQKQKARRKGEVSPPSGSIAEKRDHTRSIMIAGAMPPAAHMVTRPRRRSRRSSSSSSVPIRIAPVAPIG